jgi:hypothetical protein
MEWQQPLQQQQQQQQTPPMWQTSSDNLSLLDQQTKPKRQ